jgi:hypothetical protein
MKLTAEEIIKKFEDAEIEVGDFAYGDPDIGYDYAYEDGGEEASEAYAEKFNALKEEVGGYKQVAQNGGMDRGSDYYIVNYFPAHDVYIKTQGYYQSHHGTDWEEGYGYEVKPQEERVLRYEPVK